MAYVANSRKADFGYYYGLAVPNAAGGPRLGALLLVAAGLQSEDVLTDYVTVADVLAASNDEASFAGYARLTLPPPVMVVDNQANRVVWTLSGLAPVLLTWQNAGVAGGPLAAGQNNQLGKVVWFLDPNPAGSSDATRLHLGGAAISFTTDGTTLVLTLGADGLAYAGAV